MSNEKASSSSGPQFNTDYAKSDTSYCRGCHELISMGVLRMSVRYCPDMRDRIQDNWFHVECFDDFAGDEEIDENIGGIELLQWEDQEMIRQKIADSKKKLSVTSDVQIQIKNDESNKKRKSLESGTASIPEKKLKVDSSESDLKAKLEWQTIVLCKIRKELTEKLFEEETEEFLKLNNRYVCKTPRANIEQITDCIVFGVPEKCPKCRKGTLSYCVLNHTYKCGGKISDYTSCPHQDRNPPRLDLKVPEHLKKNVFKFAFPKKAMLMVRSYPKCFDVVNLPRSPLIDKLKNRRSLPECNKKNYLKDGCIIDGRCEFAKNVYVFVDTGGTLYQANLSQTDINEDINSFYTLQVLKHDKKEEYYFYEGNGRMGTSGTFKPHYFKEDLGGAKKEFERLFLFLTKNHWQNRLNFVKNPFGYDMLDLEIAKTDNKLQPFDINTSKSNLPMPIKKLINNIFDIKIMNETLKALDIDVKKMPLGKISKKSILKAMNILSELELAIQKGSESIKILDLSNKFYTLFPHGSGGDALPLLNNAKIIHEKANLLNELSQLEISFSLIQNDTFEDNDMEVDLIDKNYEKLHCNITVLPRNTDAFQIIESYLTKNQAPAEYTDFSIQILDVFAIQRDDEEARFKKQIGNRFLLWHGSRISNFAGILSKGLKIAPPEAPSNGYMFGKGIYFADMVSKSAQYCGVVNEGEGFLLLCEVALGETQIKINHDPGIKKLKKGKSSVKGSGVIVPDNSCFPVIENGIIVPIGKAIDRSLFGLQQASFSLLFNEYIVYDEAQVKMKYLIRAKFNRNFDDSF